MKALAASRQPQVESCKTHCWGPAMVFDRLWHKQALPNFFISSQPSGVPVRCGAGRLRPGAAALCEPAAICRAASGWRRLNAKASRPWNFSTCTAPSASCTMVRANLEKELFLRDRDLFSQKLDLLFLDTTSTYVYGNRRPTFASAVTPDHRGDLLQYVICVAVDAKGWPVTWEIFPGNTADIEAFKHIVARMKERFPIGKVIVVADRAMLSAETLKMLAEDTEAPFDYILGCKLRKNKEVREQILTCGAVTEGGRQPGSQRGALRRPPLHRLPQPRRGQKG